MTNEKNLSNPEPQGELAKEDSAFAQNVILQGITSEETGLLPCPFCGGEAEVKRKGNGRWSSVVQCTDCGCRLESNESDWNTGEHWNRREQVQQPNQKILTLAETIWKNRQPGATTISVRQYADLLSLIREVIPAALSEQEQEEKE